MVLAFMPFRITTEKVKQSKSPRSVGSSRLVVGPCILCSLRSGVALAPEILFFAPLSIVTKQEPQKVPVLRARVAPAPEILCFAPLLIVMKQEPQKTKQAGNLKLLP